MSNGYEIRYNILRDAENILMQRWFQECELAKRAGADPKIPASPSAKEIKELAEELYEFVTKK